MSDDRTPVLVGMSQLVQRDVDPLKALEPLAMLEQMAHEAAADAGVDERLLRKIDTMVVLSVAGWMAENAPGFLAERLGAKPSAEYTTEVGGQIGVTAANHVAERIVAGDCQVALIAGCNNLKTLARAQKQGVELDWTVGGSGTPEMLGVPKAGSSPTEAKYGMVMPPDIYPIFENALRARHGLGLEEHRVRMGTLFSRFTDVAAANPYSWFPVARSAEELTTAVPSNRMIAFPYTKYLNAVLQTDQAAGFLMLSVAAARAAGIPEDRWIYWWGGASAEEEAWWPSERPDLAACPAMLDSTGGALANAGLEIADIDTIDFYSCFPIAVEMACEMLGLDQNDPRGFTATGGLPYGGGPASAYTLHSIASVAQRLRQKPGAKGLVTGNGWYLTKHAASIWSTEPKPGPAPTSAAPRTRPSAHMEHAPAQMATEADGSGTVEGYTVLFDREGSPARGIVLGRQQDGKRFLANTPTDRGLLEAFVATEQVGNRGKLSHVDGLNQFDPS